MTLEEEVIQLRGDLGEARRLIAELQAELERLRSEKSDLHPPAFIKPNTSKPKDPSDKDKDKDKDKQPRRKRAKDQNGARPREQTPTQIIQHKLEHCPECAYPLRHHALAGQRQVIELPPPPPVEIIEHQLFKSWCARCSKWHYASVDLSTHVMGQSRMGVRIASLIAYLRTPLRMPLRLIREYLHTVHNLLISTGEVGDLLHRVAEEERVEKAVSAIQERVRASKVVHGDETGWREGGQNGYIWLFCTPDGERYYEYDHSRAGAVAKRILGSLFKGTLVSDFYGGYNDFPGEHQRCWVHLLRDLHELKEAHKAQEDKDHEAVFEWAGQLRQLYDTAQSAIAIKGPSPPLSPPTQEQRERLYVQSVGATQELANRYANHKEHGTHPCHTLAKRLHQHLDSLYQFVLQPGVSADNNLAERSVRPVVVMRKVSGGSQSGRGSRTRMRLASLFGTWRAKGLNPFNQCLSLLSSPLTP